MILDQPAVQYGKKNTHTVFQEESVGYLITEMERLRFRRFPVVDDPGKPVGMVTSSDILGAMFQSGDASFLKLKISEIMSDEIIVAQSDTTIREVIDTMYNIGISGIPIVKDNKIMGIITEKDLLLVDQLWKETPDFTITHENGPGRPVLPENLVTEEYTFWQIADKLVNIAQRQVMVKKSDTESYMGIVTIMTLLNSFIATATIQNPKIDSLQTLSPLDMTLKPLFQRSVPMQLSSARLWMNSRGLEAFPLFHRGKPVKLLTEKDMIGYLANHL